MKALLGIRKHLCVIPVIHHKHKKGTETQNHYTTKSKHLTMDSRRLIERWKKKGNQKEKLPLYLEKFLNLSTLKSSVGQSDNVLERMLQKGLFCRLRSTVL